MTNFLKNPRSDKNDQIILKFDMRDPNLNKATSPPKEQEVGGHRPSYLLVLYNVSTVLRLRLQSFEEILMIIILTLTL